jgi:hypothetical protein
VEGPLAPYFEPYSEYLAGRGYSQVSYWKKTFIDSDFSRWLGQEVSRRSARCCGIAARRPRGGMRRSIWKACARSPCHGAT